MRIAIVINTSWNIYNFRKGLVKSLLNKGHQVIAIAPKDEYSQRLIDLGCEFLPIQLENKGTNPFKDFLLFFHLIKKYKKANADVFLQYTIKPNIYGSFAAAWLKKPTICNVSGLGTIFIHPNKISSKIGMMLYKFAFRFPSKVFFQNEDDRKLFLEKELLKEEITDVLPGSGVDLNFFKNEIPFQRNSPFIFLMIARLLKDKGLEEYAQAAGIIKQQFHQVEFQILGKMDSSKGSIEPEKLDYWIKNNVLKYLGETDNVKQFIEKSDVVVLPSYREGTPKTLLEALALSKPIVTTNVAGCKETVINEKNGYICNVKSKEDLAEKMIKIMLLSDEKLKEFGYESRKLAESKFDENTVIHKYIETINEVCKT